MFELNIEPYVTESSQKHYAAALSCSCHDNEKCTIYQNRPDACSGYRCDLLLKTINGSVALKETQQIIQKTKSQFLDLHTRAKNIGFEISTESSLWSFLQDFGEMMKERAQLATLSPRDLDFANNAFQYLQSIDRYFSESSTAAKMSDVLVAASSPKYDLSSTKDEDSVLSLVDIKTTIRFCDCPELLTAFLDCLREWNCQASPFSQHSDTDWVVWKSGESYKFSSQFGQNFYCRDRPHTLVETLNDLIYLLAAQFIKFNTRSFYVHTAALANKTGVTLLLGANKTGKTTLCMAMAKRKNKIFCDDRAVFHLDQQQISSLGYLPMYRYTRNSPDVLQPIDGFVESTNGYRAEKYIFVKLPQSDLAVFGTDATVNSIIVLERSDDNVECSLDPIEKRVALDMLIDRQCSRNRNQVEVFNSLHNTVNNAECFRLKFYDLDSACDVLEKKGFASA